MVCIPESMFYVCVCGGREAIEHMMYPVCIANALAYVHYTSDA